MTTAQQIVDGAAEELGVKTAEIALEAADYKAIFDRMNDMLAEWSYKGLTPAFEPVVNSTDEVKVDRYAVGAIKYALAIRCASAFQRPVSQALLGMANEALENLRAANIFTGKTAYPDSLPLGSGNRSCDFDDERFFPTNQTENF